MLLQSYTLRKYIELTVSLTLSLLKNIHNVYKDQKLFIFSSCTFKITLTETCGRRNGPLKFTNNLPNHKGKWRVRGGGLPQHLLPEET